MPMDAGRARLVLGARLRKLRQRSGASRGDAIRVIRGSASKLSRLESGRVKIKTRDLASLLSLYGVDDETERAALLALADPASTAGWWREYGDAVPSWLEHYLDLEQAASLIRTYEVEVVPGLLQTEDYARAVIRQVCPDAPAEERDRRVALRMARQRMVFTGDQVRLWALIDEASLLRPAGKSGVMAAQIRRLVEAARLPNVTLQVLPLSAAARVSGAGCCTLLRFAEAELPDVVFLEQLRTAVYLDKPADTDPYRDLLDLLVTEAQTPAASMAALTRLVA